MRHVLLAAWVVLCGATSAGEAIEIEPRVRVPGQPETLSVAESLLAGLEMSSGDREAVKKEVERLNKERAALFKAVEEAQSKLRAAQKDVDEATAALARQEEELRKLICDRLPQDRVAEYAVRRQLQPVIDWLKLSETQVAQLMTKQKELLGNDPRPKLAEMFQTYRTATDPEERKRLHGERIALLKSCDAFNRTWLSNIESVLTDEQKSTWRTRYRRTALPIEGGAPGATPGGFE